MHRVAIAVATFAGVTVFGQQASKPAFEAVSIKPFEAQARGGKAFVFIGRSGGPGTADTSRINWSAASLRDLLMEAYGVKRYQVEGPDWLDGNRWQITFKLPEGATKEQLPMMYQDMLADRFGLKVHHETKEFQVQELTVAKGGPKFKPTDLDAAQQVAPAFDPSKAPLPGPPKFGKDGAPELAAPGLIFMINAGRGETPTGHLVGKAQTMVKLAEAIGNQINKPVVDKTGLAGAYDFSVEFKPDMNGVVKVDNGGGRGPGDGPPDDPGATFQSAVQQQLGLKLSSGKAQLDVIVVDQAEKTPSDN